MIAAAAVGSAGYLDPFAVHVSVTLFPVLSPEHAAQSALPPTAPPSLHALRRRPHPVSQGHHGFVRALHRYYEARPTPHLFPDSFVSSTTCRGPGAEAIPGQMRSPRFRRDLFLRDVAFDPGRATQPRIAVTHMAPSAFATASAPASSFLSWLNPTPCKIAVYASGWSSPSTPQHSLPGGRYPLPRPDFHRLDRASFAWRTANLPLQKCVVIPAVARNAESRDPVAPPSTLPSGDFERGALWVPDKPCGLSEMTTKIRTARRVQGALQTPPSTDGERPAPTPCASRARSSGRPAWWRRVWRRPSPSRRRSPCRPEPPGKRCGWTSS